MMAHEVERPEKVDPEVVEKAQRRRFSASYKQKILDEIARCSDGAERGRVLRREGLYRSHISTWSRQRNEGALAGLRPKKRGRRPQPVDRQAGRVNELEREVSRLRKKLEQAETIIDVQKKLSQLLGESSEGSP